MAKKFLTDIDMNTGKIINLAQGTNPADAVTLAQLQSALSGLDFQADIKATQVDATLNPGTPVAGDRYILTNTAALHANFGAIAGVGNGDIVQYSGSAFTIAYDVSVKGSGAIAWDTASAGFKVYDGTAWSAFGGLAGVTAGNGLVKTGNTIDVVVGNGLASNADIVDLALDGATLTKSASGLKVTDNTYVSKLGTTTANNIASFLNTTGDQKDSGVSAIGLTHKYSTDVGDGSATSYVITHNLNSKDVVVSVHSNTSTYDVVECDVKKTTVNTVTLTFSTAPTSAAYRVTVVG